MRRLGAPRVASLPPFLNLFARTVARVLWRRKVVGIYVNGSLTMGDFQPGSSDIDFLVVTRDALRRSDLDEVRAMHEQLAKITEWGLRLEGEYVGRRSLGSAGVDGPAIIVQAGRARFARRRTPLTAENMRAFRDASLPLIGPPARRVLPRVPAKAVRRALDTYLAGLLRTRMRRRITKLSIGAQSKVLASWVLNIAGCLFGRRLGRPCAKTEAARWLSRWHPPLEGVLSAALAVRRGRAAATERRLLRESVENVRSECEALARPRRRARSKARPVDPAAAAIV